MYLVTHHNRSKVGDQLCGQGGEGKLGMLDSPSSHQLPPPEERLAVPRETGYMESTWAYVQLGRTVDTPSVQGGGHITN